MKTGVKNLKCILTDAEWRQGADDLAKTTATLRNVENEKAEQASSYGSRIKDIKAKLDRLSSVVAQGYEWRDVEVEFDQDYANRVIRTIRVDTGEVCEERPMTRKELEEQPLPFGEAAEAMMKGTQQ